LGRKGWEILPFKLGSDSDEATLELSDMEVALEPGATGDLKVEIGGTAGLKGEIVVAKVQSPVTATAAAAPQVKVGQVAEVGDVTITETAAGAIAEDKDLILDLPEGVRFAAVPVIEVVSGDLKVDEGSVRLAKDGEEDDNLLVIPIEGSSTEASSIKISGIKYVVDRTVPEGKIELKVKGSAVADVNDPVEVNDYYLDLKNDSTEHTTDVFIQGEKAFRLEKSRLFPQSTTVAGVANAVVGTPAPDQMKLKATFTIGQARYFVGGVEQTMDVVPYVKGGRTFLPVRFAGYALGLGEGDVVWDGRAVTLMKGNRVVQLVPGKSQMLVNGAPVNIDAAPEVKNGRLMLPLRWIGNALGATVDWDASSQTVTLSF
jgi:hypothetical protein